RYGGKSIAKGQCGVSASCNGSHEISFAARETAASPEPEDTSTQGHCRGTFRRG
ncbi:hypothetical protein M9458_002046, partial [Cirrhinus mrigala]